MFLYISETVSFGHGVSWLLVTKWTVGQLIIGDQLTKSFGSSGHAGFSFQSGHELSVSVGLIASML